ncbi:MAG: sigma-54-dependent Fis family transcriptional regulator, partial [Deltaproteobacteria bacterium]|nr:sigma-54-dependent Fis family transcriptional regulator [Deltaproteobacteria bacterium]
PVMRRLFRILPDVARSDVPVLIEGPSGTGKEMVAQALHRLSSRAEKPYVRVNCGALPDTLLESELFGFRKGAFTDARRDHPGRFATADGGTLLLDEIGETSPAFQVKVLRVLEDGEVQPLGADAPIKVDVRILASTNRDLSQMVAEGTFREDLYYRLRVVALSLLPLRDRPEDVPPLIDHLLERIALKRGREVPGVTEGALHALTAYGFPGNVRELENILERALVLSRGEGIGLEHLPPEVVQDVDRLGQVAPGTPSPLSLRRSTRDIASLPPEGRKIVEALDAHHWHRVRAAEALGISRTTLWRHMKRYGLI